VHEQEWEPITIRKPKIELPPPKIKPIPETWYLDECAKKFVRVLASDFGVPPPKVMYIDKEIYRKEENRRIYGLYHISNKIIQLFRGSNGSIVLHEFVHYLQDLVGELDSKRWREDPSYRKRIEDEVDELTTFALWPIYEDIARRIYERGEEVPPDPKRRARLCEKLAYRSFVKITEPFWVLDVFDLRKRPEKNLREIEEAVKSAKNNAESFLMRLSLLYITCKGKMMPKEFPEGDPFGELVNITKEIIRLAERYLARTGIDRLNIDEVYRIEELDAELRRKHYQLVEELLRHLGVEV
jgi:hypothetical protein